MIIYQYECIFNILYNMITVFGALPFDTFYYYYMNWIIKTVIKIVASVHAFHRYDKSLV